MKKIFISILTILNISIVIGQIKKDKEIVDYIIAHKEFIEVTDASKIPYAFMPCYEIILDYMASNNMNKGDYYFWTPFVHFKESTLSIPICHYDGFVARKKLDDENLKAEKEAKGETFSVEEMSGNLSGKDGYLDVDLITKKVIKFRLWS